MASVPFSPAPLLQDDGLLKEIFEECNTHGIPFLDGLISSYCPNADPESEVFTPIRTLHEVLVRDGQMSEREAATLIDKSFYSLAQALPE